MKSFFYLVLLLSLNAFAQRAEVEVSLTSLHQDTLKVGQLLLLSGFVATYIYDFVFTTSNF